MTQLHRFQALLLCSFLLSPATAQISWDDGGPNKNWSNVFNWSPNGIPGAGNDVVIGDLLNAQSDATIVDQDFTVNSLELMNFTSVDTAGNKLTTGDVTLGLGTDLIVSEHNSGTRALQLTGLTVNNLAVFQMNGGNAAIGGSVTTNLGGGFSGFGEFRFLNGLNNPTTVFTNNGSFGTGRAAGALPTEHFTLNLVANDVDARIDLDGTTNNRQVSIAENTTLNLGFRALDFGGTFSMSAGSVFDTAEVLQMTSTSQMIINAEGSAGVPETATIQGAGINALNGSLIRVDEGTLVIASNFFANPGATIDVGAGEGLQVDGNATIDGDLETAGIFKLTVNGDLTINDNEFDWDGSGSNSSFTTINAGGKLTVNSNEINFDDQYRSVININNGGILETNLTGVNFGLGETGVINMVSSNGTSELNGTDVDLHGTLNANGGTSLVRADLNLKPGGVINTGSNSSLRLRGDLVYDGGTHTGPGAVRFENDITVNGPTVFNMQNGGVELDNVVGNQTMNVNQDLTINAGLMIGEIGDTGNGIFTINVDNTDSTLTVNLTNANSEWSLGPDSRLNVTGSGTLQTSLDGSPVNVRGVVTVNDSTRFGARVDLEDNASISIVGASVLHMDGGSQSDPNQLAGGFITGTGQLRSFNSGIRGHGQINNDIFFNGGSDLIAEDDRLIFNGAVLDVDLIGAGAGGNLQLGQALDTSDATALQMSGGMVTGAGIANFGDTVGFGTIATSSFVNHNLVQAKGGGQLRLATTTSLDLDGPGENALIEALSADLVIANQLTEAFDGTARVGTGQAIDFENSWTLGPTGSLLLDGSVGNPASLRGAQATLNGTVRVGGIGRVEAPTTFRPTGRFDLDNGNDVLELAANATIQPGAQFSGNGFIRNLNGAQLTLAVGSDVDVPIVNDGRMRLTAPLGSVDLAELQLEGTSDMLFRLEGTAVTDFDHYIVNRNVTVDGNVEVDLVGGFAPSLNDAFVLLQATTGLVSGQFSTFDLPSLTGDLAWQFDYSDPQTVWLRVVEDMISGDFDGNGDYACNDVDMLVSVIANGSNDLNFDLTNDGNVDGMDLDAWLAEAGAAELASGNPYLKGDANLDGTVDGLDFIAWNDNKFTSTPAWCSGDFNADGTVDGLDFIVWNDNKFMSADATLSPVPEPTSVWLLLMGLVAACSGHKRQN